MGDTRHKRKYPEGERKQMTPAWKQRVRDRLAENKRNNIYPRDQVELAAAIGAADKSAVTKMLQATASKYVPIVCRVLQIGTPLQERKEPDALDEFVEGLAQEKRVAALELLRIAFGR
jgi:hypothetical protein